MPKRKRYLCKDCQKEFYMFELDYDEDEDEYYCPECAEWIETKYKSKYPWLFKENFWKEK